MASLADHAYAHACAVLGEGDASVDTALEAVRRGGRSRWAVLGHARAHALRRAVDAPAPALDGAAPDDLGELAVALARTRPAIERVVVDLDTRHDLDRARFGRALGLPTSSAGARASTVYVEWERALDPMVLARLGAGGCDELARVLSAAEGAPGDEGDEPDADAGAGVGETDTRPTPTLRHLLALGPVVADHAAGCATCRDRLRSMVSVRTLLAQRPLEAAPDVVQAAAGSSRLRRPSLPPPLESLGRSRRWFRPAVSVAVALALAGAGGAVAAAVQAGNGDDASTVEALTRVPAAGSALTVSDASLRGTTPPPVELTNGAGHAIEWTATADVPWLLIEPAEGTLAPAESVELRLGVTAAAPEGDVRAAARISGADGSATVVRLATTVERPPEVVAAVEAGCLATATVEDEGEVRAVELHWIDRSTSRGAERVRAMARAEGGGYQAPLLRPATVGSWWVTATDARGNLARTPTEQLPAGACN